MIKDWGNSWMVELSDWQWAIGAGILGASLIVGGWLNRQQEAPETTEPNDPHLSDQHNELHEPHPPIEARDIELRDMRKQLQARDNELSELREVRKQLQARDNELSELKEVRKQLQARDNELRELKEVRKQLEVREHESKEAQEEAELVLLLLHQVQEELEELFLQNQSLNNKLSELKEVRKQLKARDAELSELKEVRKQLKARDAEFKEAQEEAELVLLQLHQVQEELEHYFLESQKLNSSLHLAPKQLEQLQRIKQRVIQQLKASHIKDNPALTQIVRRQQNALRRFQRLHQSH